MKRGLFLLLCLGVLHAGSGLSCYRCSDYTGRCTTEQECTYEDACISLTDRDGKSTSQCIRYTDCDISRLGQVFPTKSSFSFRCCSSNLCNAASAVTAATPALALASLLVSAWWCWS
ncbi:unnamed protein product [Tetraodon nigroviridis]|uniref:(spotted green pufferfish) hypothetical protein n=1 Tax=Tetraodon nigroviridis TaxID=99883 RepID=Q4TBG8_TETNG|nr:unnamed protein product [Tetraodon nigroviridis]CAF89764.1 unnamed protein product [Tetraodon nigroviridis]